MNTVVLSGRLTRDPELRNTPSGTSVATFSLAVDRAGDKSEDGDGYEAGFFDCQVWGNQAENVCTYLSKGARAAVTGELRHHRWEAADGTKRSKVEINARWVEFLETRSEREQREGGQSSLDAPASHPTGDSDFQGTDDDIPF